MPRHSCARFAVHIRAALAAIAFLLPGATAVAAEPVTLEGALARAIASDPGAPGAQSRIAAARAGVRQADVKPNPSVGVELENFGGSGRMQGFESAEASVFYQQSLERGGKRQARVGLAEADVASAVARREVHVLDLAAQVQTAWAEAQAAQAGVAVARERLEVATGLERDVRRRVAAARDPLFAGERARTAVVQAQIDLDQAQERARLTRAALASFWGGAADFELAMTGFDTVEVAAPPRLTEDAPDLRLLAASRDAASARIALERSRAVQDPTVRGGLRYFGDGGDAALIVGASIPLGRYDTNKGAIEQAQAERLAADQDIAAARIEREREMARLTARQAAAASEIRRIETEVLPSAERAVRLVRDGFNRGGGAFTYLEVTEAERAVIDARARRIELLEQFHLDGVRLDRIAGRHLVHLSQQERR